MTFKTENQYILDFIQGKINESALRKIIAEKKPHWEITLSRAEHKQ